MPHSGVRLSQRFLWRLWVIALAVFAVSFPACGADPEPSGSTTLVEAMVDRIVYVSSTGDVFSVDPDGENLVNLTGGARVNGGAQGRVMAQPLDLDTFYYWPTWSPDGTKLAVSRVEAGVGGAAVTVEVLDPSIGGSRTVYQNEVASLVAQGAPHYLYWSPDSKYLAFLASTPQGFLLLAVDTQSQEPPMVVETGAPLYFHWGADGQTMLLHVGNTVKLAEIPFDPASLSNLMDVGQGFRVPALSPDGSQMVYSVSGDERAQVFVAETGRVETARSVIDVGQPNAFTWAPGGMEIAVADRQDPSTPVFDRLRVIAAAGGEVSTAVEESLVAFFWSPVGDKIAWVVLDPEQQLFRWKVSGVDGSDPRELFSYRPSANSLTMLNFFDQYAYSHSPWSPDGRRLVVAGTQVEHFARRNGDTPGGDRVYILDAAGVESPRELAAGILAFWSWN